jgi:beta-xylosidase
MKKNFSNCVNIKRAPRSHRREEAEVKCLSKIRLLTSAATSCLWACLCIATVSAQTTYQNPVIPGDYPDPSIIRVGKDYWATSTSSEWGPQFPLLHSTDLVNWEIAGSVFAQRPAWAVANFWAPEISEYKGRYFVYYVGRKQNGPLAVAVATAKKPSGPYTDHGPLVAQDAGSIDPVPMTDEKGARYLIWKEDGNSRKLPTIIWAHPLSEDGLKLSGEPRELLRNDAGWEGAVVEGPFVIRRDGWFYLFYSGGACCGLKCSYGLGVARSRNLLGPWEKNPANPILAGNTAWKCPGHGSIVKDETDRYWLLYHAYSATNFIFTGREALLDEVKFGGDGWPTINNGKGPAVEARSPFATVQKRPKSFEDRLNEAPGPGWQWPQDQSPGTIRNLDGNSLALFARPEFTNDLLGVVLGRSTTSGDYTATVTVGLVPPTPGSVGGLAAVGDRANAAGLAAGNGKLILWRRDRGQHKMILEEKAPETRFLHLKLTASKGSTFKFAYSSDGKEWTSIGGPQPGDKFPPWDRSIRVALTAGGVDNAAAVFREFRLLDE